MNLVEMEAVSWNRFLTRYFAVVPELLGQSHNFRYDQATISVELPTIKDFSPDPRMDARDRKSVV